ncbi:MAG: hypothetical protein LW832_04465 [Parachlamydia sp.]|nr:hypothetical protein [Parachlamydia sp.]
MGYSEFCKDRLGPHKIKSPYIDRNLQIQIPEDFPSFSANYNPVYSYFSPQQLNPSLFEAKQMELNQAMENAKLSYQAWNKMKEQLFQKVKQN